MFHVEQAWIEALREGASELQIPLQDQHFSQFERYLKDLIAWNKKTNLTAITDDKEIAVKHFLDSLTLVKALGRKGHLLDIGAGAGFPSLPVKIVRPELHVTTVDAVEKKVIFQRHAARTLGLHGFEALHARGEELAVHHAERFDYVVSRAFSDIPTFARMALPLLKGNGRIVAMKGRGGTDEATAARAPLAELGLRIVEVLEFPLPVTGDRRALVVIERQPS